MSILIWDGNDTNGSVTEAHILLHMELFKISNRIQWVSFTAQATKFIMGSYMTIYCRLFHLLPRSYPM